MDWVSLGRSGLSASVVGLDRGAENLVDAAYRYCRHAAPNSVILTGTGNPAHLEANVASLLSPPLAPVALARLAALFGKIDSISGD